MDNRSYLDALEEALERTGRKPQIFNADQVCQITSKEWTDRLVELDISMDGRAHTDGPDAQQQIGEFIEQYNTWRPHSAHGDRAPNEVYNYDMVAKKEKALK